MSENKFSFPTGSYGNSNKITSIPDGPSKGTQFPKLMLIINNCSIEIIAIYLLCSCAPISLKPSKIGEIIILIIIQVIEAPMAP